MKKILIDSLQFEGPRTFGKDEIPSVPAIALVCTEAGEGMKIMSVVHATDIAKAHAFHGNIDVYINTDEMSEDRRESFRINAISKRKEYIFCDELPKVVDDW